jgi:hypothetical protein
LYFGIPWNDKMAQTVLRLTNGGVERKKNAKGNGANWRLHPLIHTLLKFNLPQDIESIKSGASDSAVLFEKWIVKGGVAGTTTLPIIRY